MKILFVISSLRGGGAERVASTLCNHWAENGQDVILVTLDGKQNDFYKTHANINRFALDSYTSSKNILDKIRANLKRLYKIARIVRKTRPDVVVAFMDVSNVLATMACIGTRIPVVISERSYPPYFHDNDLFDRFRRFIYQFSHAFVAQTKKIADWGHAFLNKPIKIIVNPIADKALNTSHDVVRSNIVLGMGRLHPDKGFDLLIDAFNLCHEKCPEWKLVIAGRGPEQTKLENKIREYSLQTRVSLIGEVENPQDYYARAKVFVLSSRVEGFPNVLIEAMANGLPVTSFDCNSGPGDIIQHEVDGLLVPPMQIEELASSMQRLINDSQLRESLGKKAALTKDLYSLNAISDQWMTLFKELVPNER